MRNSNTLGHQGTATAPINNPKSTIGNPQSARADVMYGVTMEEFGVSKPVGMRLTADDGQGNKTEAKSAAPPLTFTNTMDSQPREN